MNSWLIQRVGRLDAGWIWIFFINPILASAHRSKLLGTQLHNFQDIEASHRYMAFDLTTLTHLYFSVALAKHIYIFKL